MGGSGDIEQERDNWVVEPMFGNVSAEFENSSFSAAKRCSNKGRMLGEKGRECVLPNPITREIDGRRKERDTLNECVWVSCGSVVGVTLRYVYVNRS